MHRKVQENLHQSSLSMYKYMCVQDISLKVCRNRIPIGFFGISFVMRLVWDIDFARWLAFVYK